MSSPKEFHMDAVYPEPLSRLRRGHGLPNSCSESSSSPSYRRAVRKQMRRGAAGSGGRFRTQPVTFHEIQEVDEENLAETEPENASTAGTASKSESDLKAKFELFYRSIGAPTTGGNNDKNFSQKDGSCSSEAGAADFVPVANSSTENANVPPPPPLPPNFAATTTVAAAAVPPIPFVTIKKHRLTSQDDSSTSARASQIPDNSSFNPKSRPSL